MSKGPITFVSPNVFISLYDMAALCWPGIIRIFALPTIFAKGYNSRYSEFNATFGQPLTSRTKHIRDAVEILKEKKVDFEFDGDMQPDVALNSEYEELYPFAKIVGKANILIMPGQHSAAISYKLMKTFGDTKVIGPLLIGLGLPIEIAPLRSSTSEIINLASIAAYSSEVIDYKK